MQVNTTSEKCKFVTYTDEIRFPFRKRGRSRFGGSVEGMLTSENVEMS